LKTCSEEKTIILINAEGLYNSDNREELPGVEILIWLRCKHYIVNPVIFYGFQTTASILHRHPEHLIIHSEGCYYLRLPFNLNKIKNIVVDEVNNLSRIRKHLAAGFNMEVFRHKFANIWGINRLKIAHDQICCNNHDILNGIENKEILIAKFIYVSEKYKDIKDKSLLKNIKKFVKQYQAYICNRKILYIDDQATKGWSEILREVLNLSKDNFQVFNYFPDDINNLINMILVRIRDFQPDCILLDLRLRRDDEYHDFGDQYTGDIVAEKIKQKYVSLPVIMFTASNKVENLRKALRSGCETLWTKEGIDEYKGINFTMQNYFRLVESVYNACKKFELPNAKVNYASDKLLEGIEKRIHKTNFKYLNNKVHSLDIFKEFDFIIPDTNFFIQDDEKLMPGHMCNIFILLYLCKEIVNTEFHFNDEVFLELLRHSKKDIVYAQNEKEKVTIDRARYITSKIFYWQSKDLIRFSKPDTVTYGKKLRNNGIVETVYDNQYSPKSDVNADYVLKDFIVNQIKNKKTILFINNDNGCAWNVGKELEQGGHIVLKTSKRYIKEITRKEDVNEVMKNKNDEVVYRRMDLREFNQIFDIVRETIMEISLLE